MDIRSGESSVSLKAYNESDEEIALTSDAISYYKTSASSVTVMANDENFDKISYAKNGGNILPQSGNTLTIDKVGAYDITATDLAGNSITKKVVIVDKPQIVTVPSDISDGQTVNKDVTVTVTGEANKYYVNDEEKVGSTTLSDSGEYSVKVTDIFNSASELAFTINKDALDAPTISVTPNKATNTKRSSTHP